MGTSSGTKGDLGNSSRDKTLNGNNMDTDDYYDLSDEDDMDSSAIHDLSEPFLRDFSRKAATAFFNEYGLISHQINSFNDFIQNGLQKVFESFGDLIVEPGYDPSRKGENDWRYALVRFGKVSLGRPQFWAGEKLAESGKGNLNLLPRHARLQNMTYSSKMKVDMFFQVTSRASCGCWHFIKFE